MTLDDIVPELRPSVRRMPPVPFTSGIARMLMNTMLGMTPTAKVEGVTTTVLRHAARGVRLYLPAAKPAGALLWIHGGGYVIGHAILGDRFLAETARRLGIAVVSVEYRLAPRHPFPAPLDDCAAAWDWLQQQAAVYGIDPARIAIGGQSAGGGLAAALVQRLHDAGDTQPVAQWLFCPMLDDRTATRRDLDEIGHFLWNNRNNDYGWRSYLGTAPGTPDLPPYAVPSRRASLAGLPPAWIGVSDVELFYEEDTLYAERLQETGVEATVDVVQGAPHGFESIAPDTAIAQAYVARAQAWLSGRLIPTARP